MSRSAGTGSPVWFRCFNERRGIGVEHEVTLTGRTRPFSPSRALGSRSTFTSYEYACSCGHVGWSNHVELALKAGLSWEEARETQRKGTK